MLESLDSIDWGALRHAHGDASNVPDLLRALLSDDEDVRMEAISTLHEHIWHQGTVYTASAAAVPFLFELLSHPDVQDKGGIVSLLSCIATGEAWVKYGIRVDGEATMRRRLGKEGRTLDDALTEETAMMQAIHGAMSSGLQHLLPYLNDEDGLAAVVADVVGNYPEHRSWLLPAIDAALASQSDVHVRHLLAQSKARLSRAPGAG